MLDPRIYRTGFIAVALAAIVFAFSLHDQQGPLSSTLASDAFNGTNAYSTMRILAGRTAIQIGGPDRPATTSLAAYVKSRFNAIAGLKNVSTTVFSGRTVDGNRTLETVAAVRPGLSPGNIVIVAHRDSLELTFGG